MTILEDIIANKRVEVARIPFVEDAALVNSTHDFIAPFLQDYLGVIAELKSKSPSAGFIVEGYNPISIAREYVEGGADALSVLTDQMFFSGHIDHLRDVRRAVDVPILCKDFFVDVKQVRLARSAGADACLLMMSVLPDENLLELKQAIESWGMDALIEVQNISEVERALRLSPKIVGINNRDLNDFSMNTKNSAQLCDQFPDEICVISASGVTQPGDVTSYPDRINGVLIGTSLMQAKDKAAFIRDVRGAS